MFLLALLLSEHGNEKISIDFFQLFFGPMNTLTSNSSPLRAHALRFQCQMCVVRLSIDAMFIKMFVKRCRRLAKTRHGRERTKRGGSWPVEGSFSKDKEIKVLYTLRLDSGIDQV